MRIKLMAVSIAVCTLSGCFLADREVNVTAVGAEGDVALDFPVNYKANAPYMIADRVGQDDQVMVMYSNEIARKGTRETGKIPYGSVLVGEVYKAKKDANGEVIKTRLGRRIPDKLSAIVVMERRKGWDAQYPEELKVGDWEFEVFSPAGENLNKDTTGCRKCHHPLTDIEYTFSYAHLAAAN